MSFYFESLKSLSHDIADYLSQENLRFSPRPYNMFTPERSLWWIIPSSEWPAYKHGKLFLKKNNNSLSFGLNVEKGFGSIVGQAYPECLAKNLVMDESWKWSLFSKDSETDLLDDVIKNMVLRTKEKLFISISAGIASDPEDYDPDAPKTDQLVFEKTGDELIMITNEADRVLQDLSKSKSLKDMVYQITRISESPWIWCDFDIWIDQGRASRQSDSISISDLVSKIDPLLRWVYPHK